MARKPKLTYESAYDELEQILRKIEGGEVPVDELADNIKRAGELIEFCKNKLRDTEAAVSKLLDE